MNGIQGMSSAEFSGALYAALSKRQAVAEARRRGWSGDDARAGKSAICDWLGEHVPANEREAVLNSVVAETPPVAEQPAPKAEQPKPADSNADSVAQAIAAALRTLNVKAGIDADAVRAIVDERMANVQPREIAVKVGDGPSVKVEGRAHPMFDKVVKLVAAGVNVLLVGPAGCGKSHLAKQVAHALGRKFGTLHCSAGASESQVTGWLLPIGKGGAFEFKPSQFATLYSEGNSVFLVDEIDAGDPNMLMVLNGALANGALHIPQCPDRPEWERGENAAIVAAANTYGHGADAVYAGRNQLDAATLDRFYVVEMEYDTALEKEIGAAQPELYRWHSSLRERANDAKLRRVVSTRVLQKGVAALNAGIPMAQVKADLLAGWTRDERNKVGE